MEFTVREKSILVWLVLGEYGECVERAYEVAGKQLDLDASDPRRKKYEDMRVDLKERLSTLEGMLFKLGYRFGGISLPFDQSPEEVQQ